MDTWWPIGSYLVYMIKVVTTSDDSLEQWNKTNTSLDKDAARDAMALDIWVPAWHLVDEKQWQWP